MDTSEAFSLMCRAIDAGRANRGFLVCGDLPGSAEDFARLVAGKLFDGSVDHPDISTVEPTGVTRTIKVKTIKEGFLDAMSVTSFSGGWKLGIIKGADRFTVEAANAFLKSLEEPTSMTMYLLLTDNPDDCLPTIVSRCQRIDLPRRDRALHNEEREAVCSLFTAPYPVGSVARETLAQKLSDYLESLKDGVENQADTAIIKRRFYATVMGVMRQWLVDGLLDVAKGSRNIEVVEEAFQRSTRSLGYEMGISLMVDKISFPST